MTILFRKCKIDFLLVFQQLILSSLTLRHRKRNTVSRSRLNINHQYISRYPLSIKFILQLSFIRQRSLQISQHNSISLILLLIIPLHSPLHIYITIIIIRNSHMLYRLQNLLLPLNHTPPKLDIFKERVVSFHVIDEFFSKLSGCSGPYLRFKVIKPQRFIFVVPFE